MADKWVKAVAEVKRVIYICQVDCGEKYLSVHICVCSVGWLEQGCEGKILRYVIVVL